MILDSSAIVSVILREKGSDRVLDTMETAESCRIGAPTLVETAMVLTGRLGDDGRTILLSLLQEINVDVLSFGDAHWRIAQSAFVRYGKGRHPAALNFGDCLTYATAYVAGEPLLCVGEDFTQTDLELALPPAS
ncbi:type II toxin-antitoxin system VapC family toxin [Actinophytocola sp.]|uniref:type II toxin-antitoxin system VapC family toxin n=1 Tax=Actinophytocola sp. TaxID=1872138 RepID=UPI00389B218A